MASRNLACCAARPAVKPVAAIALSLLVLGSVRAEVVYSNLNTDSSTQALAYSFAQYAQRFTTASAGTGLRLDLNIISGTGSQSYAVELWSANGPGDNLDALLAPIGSGTVSTTDVTALTSFDLSYGLTASTNYFVRLTTTPDVVWVLGPNSSTALNSVFRYGVATLNNTDSSLAGGMKVDVVAVPEPTRHAIAIAGLACCGYSMWRRYRNREWHRSLMWWGATPVQQPRDGRRREQRCLDHGGAVPHGSADDCAGVARHTVDDGVGKRC